MNLSKKDREYFLKNAPQKDVNKYFKILKRVSQFGGTTTLDDVLSRMYVKDKFFVKSVRNIRIRYVKKIKGQIDDMNDKLREVEMKYINKSIKKI